MIRKTCNFFYRCLCLSPSDLDKPLSIATLKDSESIEFKFIMYLYTMEPPLYYDLNKASREVDMDKVETLGPLAKALYTLLDVSITSSKYEPLHLKQGILNGYQNPMGKFAKSFLLFRGVHIEEKVTLCHHGEHELRDLDLVELYQEKIGELIKMNNIISATKKF